MLRRVTTFIKNTVIHTKNYVVNFAKGMIRHAEATVILTFSAVGLNTMIGELPFIYAMPVWVEAPMVIPVLSIALISLLLRSAEFRATNRYVAF